jgi:hypothetical protein
MLSLWDQGVCPKERGKTWLPGADALPSPSRRTRTIWPSTSTVARPFIPETAPTSKVAATVSVFGNMIWTQNHLPTSQFRLEIQKGRLPVLIPTDLRITEKE